MSQNKKMELENTKSEIIGIYDENDNYVEKRYKKKYEKK